MKSISTTQELLAKSQWVNTHLMEAAAAAKTCDLPFSFIYDGKPSAELLAVWPHTQDKTVLDTHRVQYTICWTDPKTSLEVHFVSVEYADYPAIEWTVYFNNTGKANTPLLEHIQGIDTTWQRTATGEFVLHGNNGDWCVSESYAPYQDTLGPGMVKEFAPDGGRPTNGPHGWPYFNLQMPGGGVLLAVGWPGQWAASFTRDTGTGLHLLAGQQLTHLILQPGEKVRTPLIALLFWQGVDMVRAQNIWRRWFMAHNIPRLNGQPPAPITQIQLCKDFNDGATVMQEEVERYAKAGIDIDLYWRDAGWYPCGGQWWNTGNWEVDAVRFPDGFTSIANWIHHRGKKLIVWFEPERIGDPHSWLAKNHPEWILGGNLLNLGNPEAWQWVVAHFDNFIRQNEIDYYRQDFNMDPLSNWRNNDAPDRQGMTENLYVQGYLSYWDELRRRHPTMLLDSCASGGRRNDLETLRRSVPLLRSDFQPPNSWEAQQGQTFGLSSWVPYYGSGVYSADQYPVRSFYMPCFGIAWNQDMNKSKVLYDECRKVAPLMLGDFYPLTAYSLQLDQWIAWQFDRPEEGDGVIQAFRRDRCEQGSYLVHLYGLDSNATYELINFDIAGVTQITGNELMKKGLTVDITDKPGAAVITYRRKQ